ncbi:hypothetical protein LCGC14_2798160 [marine sediment metagenome]|uniref:Uncharacterized protein n=1 Tax=marine sediment metagenome TaxID=412755 RepID=A0A0F8YNN0_9ZZZZ
MAKTTLRGRRIAEQVRMKQLYAAEIIESELSDAETDAVILALRDNARRCCVSCSLGLYLYKDKNHIFDWWHVSGNGQGLNCYGAKANEMIRELDPTHGVDTRAKKKAREKK